jgi:hypothetical protein
MIRKILIIVVMGCLLTEQGSYSQNTTQTDSVKSGDVRDKITLSIGWKALYITNDFRGSNFVRRIEMSYRINEKWKIGGSAFWGWRFGKNFGEDIGSSINERLVPLEKPIDDKPYGIDEWFRDRILNKGPGYALNFKYKGYGVFTMYQIDKNGIGRIFNRKLHWFTCLGASYVTGEIAGDLLYVYKEDVGIAPFVKSEYLYYFVYEKVRYTNISVDAMLRLEISPQKKDFILPGFSIYYVYAPDQVKSGMKNFGWLWDIKILLWKQK